MSTSLFPLLFLCSSHASWILTGNSWSAQRNDRLKWEREKLDKIFEEILQGKAPHVLKEGFWSLTDCKRQCKQAVESYVRASVEV